MNQVEYFLEGLISANRRVSCFGVAALSVLWYIYRTN